MAKKRREFVGEPEQRRLQINAVRNLPGDGFEAALADLDITTLQELQHQLEVEAIPLEIQEKYGHSLPVPTPDGETTASAQVEKRIDQVKAAVKEKS